MRPVPASGVSLSCRDSNASRKFYEQASAPLGCKVGKEYGDSFGSECWQTPARKRPCSS